MHPFLYHLPPYEVGDVLYHCPLAKEEDIRDWRWEGKPVMDFSEGKLCLRNGLGTEAGQAANYLLWAPIKVAGSFRASWKFQPLEEPGLAMFWFAANGTEGRDLFDPSLAPRNGQYRQYHSGDMNAYHLSYFRRKNPDERGFHTCNMRKSHGFHLVCQGADPIPSIEDVQGEFEIQVVRLGDRIELKINELPVFCWEDDGSIGGPAHREGYFGFRQMAPLVATYSDFKVESIKEKV